MSVGEQPIKKTAKWTEEQTYKFVEEYIKHPCLYNVKLPSYKNRNIRNEALLKISQIMNVPKFGRNEVYSKIRSIKSTYSQELKKIKDSSKSGAATDDIYISRLKWFDLLNDILNSLNIDQRTTQNNMEDEEEHSITTESTLGDVESLNEVLDGSDAIETEERRKNIKMPRKRSVRDLNELVDKVKKVSHSLNTHSANNSINEFDAFGSSVAAQLKSMPLHLALKSQIYIQNYLSNIRLQRLDQENNIPVQPSGSSWLSPPPPESPASSFPQSPSLTLLLMSPPLPPEYYTMQSSAHVHTNSESQNSTQSDSILSMSLSSIDQYDEEC